MQQDNIIMEKLENHEKRITKSEGDIGNIKITAASQDVTIKTLNNSMERLTDTINKVADKFDGYLMDSGKQNNSSWQWKVGTGISISITIIMFLLNLLNK